MFDRTVRSVMQRRKLLKAPPQTLVSKAAKQMARKGVGAILVIEAARLVGILTERDIVFRVVAAGRDAASTPIADVMTPAPVTIDPEQPFGCALALMYERDFRHLPVIENGRPVGIVSARSAMDPELEEFASEARRREHFRPAP